MHARVTRLSKGRVSWDTKTRQLTAAEAIKEGTVLWLEKSLLPSVPLVQPYTGRKAGARLKFDEAWRPMHSLTHLLRGEVEPEALVALLEVFELTECPRGGTKVIDAHEILGGLLFNHNAVAERRLRQLTLRTRVRPGIVSASFPITDDQLRNVTEVMQGGAKAEQLDVTRHVVIQLAALFTVSEGLQRACFASATQNVHAATFMYKGLLHEAVVAMKPIPKGSVLWRGVADEEVCNSCGACESAYDETEWGGTPKFVAQCVLEARTVAQVEALHPAVQLAMERRYPGWAVAMDVSKREPLANTAHRAQMRSIIAHASKSRYWRQLPRVPALAAAWASVPQPRKEVWCQLAPSVPLLLRPPHHSTDQVLMAFAQADGLLEEEHRLRQAVQRAKEKAATAAEVAASVVPIRST